ncbi:MAG: AbrB/MazE/SpoVT family DNA-binding domain-containing protein [Thermodesulfobacteriota bacterium]|nr:AbrB/MazE/SpoVT family DNA-binding domain-containing protein [Thermodesulfobacteriota bacterium]
MRLTIDKLGRIVIPKALRDDLQLTSGTVLEVEEKADHLLLRPFHEQPALMHKNGFLVYTGKPVNSLDTVVKQGREERLLRENIEAVANIVPLIEKEYLQVVANMAELELAGGVVYDAIICRSCSKK